MFITYILSSCLPPHLYCYIQWYDMMSIYLFIFHKRNDEKSCMACMHLLPCTNRHIFRRFCSIKSFSSHMHFDFFLTQNKKQFISLLLKIKFIYSLHSCIYIYATYLGSFFLLYDLFISICQNWLTLYNYMWRINTGHIHQKIKYYGLRKCFQTYWKSSIYLLYKNKV